MSVAIATLESVRRAKAVLEQRGERVTVKAVRLLLNGGSHSTITRHLRTLRGAQVVPADVAKHLLAESRRQRSTIDEMRDELEPVIIEDDPDHRNITVEVTCSICPERKTDFLATVCERWEDLTGGLAVPVRTAYVLRVAVTHSSWPATVVSGAEDPRHG